MRNYKHKFLQEEDYDISLQAERQKHKYDGECVQCMRM